MNSSDYTVKTIQDECGVAMKKKKCCKKFKKNGINCKKCPKL